MSKQTERDAFRSRWGFILACIGSAVGMGNIWRFPYLVSAWGGMTFLLPYFLFVLLIGSTGIIGEMALGRSTRSGPIGAFGQAAALRGRRSTGEAVGYIPVLGSLALAIGYSCVVGWIFKYFALALDGGLFAMGQDMNVIVDRFNGTACGWGNNFWLVIALAVNFAIMAFRQSIRRDISPPEAHFATSIGLAPEAENKNLTASEPLADNGAVESSIRNTA